jgi:hypothetical protein
LEKWILGLLVVLVAGRGAYRSFEDAAANDIRSRLVEQTGAVELRVKPEGLFGYMDGGLALARISGTAIGTDGMPFWTEPGYSQYARIGELRMRLTDVTVTGLRVKLLDVTIPDCRYDRGYAWSHKRIRITRSGTGTGRVEATAEALAEFLMRKYETLSDLELHLDDGKFEISGKVSILHAYPFRASGDLAIEDGLRIVITKADVDLGGERLSEAAAQEFIKGLNPVLDEQEDLHLLDSIHMRKLTLEDDLLIVEGDAKIPIEPGSREKEAK